MSQEHIDRWQVQAQALRIEDIRTLAIPVAAFLQEATGTAHFLDRYWPPSEDGVRPGLDSVGTMLAHSVSDEIRSLSEACRTLHTRVLFPNGDVGVRKATLERAQFVADELESALEFVLEDGVDEPTDEALRAAKERADDDSSQARLAQSLADFAAVADRVRDRLTQIRFDLALIDEARSLATSLVAQGTPSTGRSASGETAMRDRMLTLLAERVNAVRRAARYVFRKHPDIVRLATSAYERRRRLSSKTTKKRDQSASALLSSDGAAPSV